jgi:hypothetical protein
LNEEHNFGKVIMLTTRENLAHLGESTIWMCDGTFFVCPREFYQLFTIFGFVKNKPFPLVYCLLPSKKEEVYEFVFSFLKNKLKSLKLMTLLCDFELAIPNSFF